MSFGVMVSMSVLEALHPLRSDLAGTGPADWETTL